MGKKEWKMRERERERERESERETRRWGKCKQKEENEYHREK